MTKRKPLDLLTMFDDKYPPRGTWEVHRCGHGANYDYNHGGFRFSRSLLTIPNREIYRQRFFSDIVRHANFGQRSRER